MGYTLRYRDRFGNPVVHKYRTKEEAEARAAEVENFGIKKTSIEKTPSRFSLKYKKMAR